MQTLNHFVYHIADLQKVNDKTSISGIEPQRLKTVKLSFMDYYNHYTRFLNNSSNNKTLELYNTDEPGSMKRGLNLILTLNNHSGSSFKLDHKLCLNLFSDFELIPLGNKTDFEIIGDQNEWLQCNSWKGLSINLDITNLGKYLEVATDGNKVYLDNDDYYYNINLFYLNSNMEIIFVVKQIYIMRKKVDW